MADAPDSAVDRKAKPRGRPIGALVALGFVVVAIPLLLLAARDEPDREDRLRDPLELSDARELRAVVEAVSGVIQAGAGEPEEQALRALEALHPRSPGAADLRDSCVTTYRGAHDAQAIQGELHGLMPADGGELSEAQRRRVGELLDRSQRLVNDARDASNRCVGLYEQAAGRLHIAPAQRPHHP